jgi:hypothetical protein
MTAPRAKGTIIDESARESFEESRHVVEAWDRAHPVGVEGILDFIDQLRSLFGDPPVCRLPWRGDDFRVFG